MVKSSPLLVAQVTDTHLFAESEQQLMGIATNDTLQAVLDHLSQLQPQPEILLLTGDLSQDETCASYRRLHDLLTPLEIPTYWIPGNHDSLPAMQQVLNQLPISAEKHFVAGGWHFLLLSSLVPGCVYGQIAPESLEWLEQKLQLIGNQPSLIALHHPPCLIDSNWLDQINLQNSADFLAVIDRYSQVKLVIFGHIHQAFDYQRRGVRYLGSPSTCVQFKPASEEFGIERQAKPGFRLLTLMPDGTYKTTVERVNYCSSAE